ncbi:glycosyltransferase family 4 protein [Arthrobacter sp. B2a2-09]|uniref:glycosyltransferase family 4 protein n=1 Tax=Arthrobacter sp. B2a2-09 TaxID=2952822 RepID=UPI0022CD6BB8|nr:glycosyltransferase family 4 protein [Arthrobacter sp. B2a2-09]MCZ9882310.1 glycosyltransferase family 4 protein [Arthrobacter sp. B2a2-09]
MRTANIVYWYGKSEMPKDGGGLRALAWQEALTALGFETTIHALRPTGMGVQAQTPLRKLKKKLIPMPLRGALPPMTPADLNVVTVPSVFDSAIRVLPRASLIFDWMDLWSVNARTMGSASIMSRPGGICQGLFWEVRQRRLVNSPRANVFAGFGDTRLTDSADASPGHWIPTPITPASSGAQSEGKSARTVGFIGNFDYPPNVMSLRKFFKDYAGEFIQKGIAIKVAGFGSEIVKDWGFPVEVLGRVDSLSDFYGQIDAAIVPIDHGGGIKAKAVEAMAYGVPVLGTAHVANGFSPEWSSFIGRIEDLLRQPSQLPPVPSVEEFDIQFSQRAFTESVRSMLTTTGHLTAQSAL